MESFYQNWLRKNAAENQRAKNQLHIQNLETDQARESTTTITDSVASTTQVSNPSTLRISDPIPSTSHVNDPLPSTSSSVDNLLNPRTPSTITEIVFEKDGLQLLVERGMFQRQKKFSLQV
jgi:hypothetical protein